jgi:sialic acid synthase SpsE
MKPTSGTKTLRIGSRTVGPGCPCYLIAEVGTTCLGDLDMALKLIEAGAAAGMDAIKFQVIDADQLSDTSVTYPIRRGDTVEQVNMREMFARLSFSLDQWKQLAKACADRKVDFFATVDYVAGVDMLEQVGVPAYKLSAWDCTFRPLIERMGQTGKPMLVDLGPTTEPEIDDICDWYYGAGGNAVVLLHDFHTGDDREMNMAAVQYLAGRQEWPVGFSSPALDHDLDFMALGMGAQLIEKRLILDRSIRAFHAHESLTPPELKDWVDRIRHLERSVGVPSVKPSSRDREESRKHYRSICTTRPVQAGETFTPDNLHGKRPGTGIPTARLQEFWGRKAARNLDADTLIGAGDAV